MKDRGVSLAGAMIRAQKINPGLFEEFSRLLNDQTMHGVDASQEIGSGRNSHLKLSKAIQDKVAKGQKLEDIEHEAAMKSWGAHEAQKDLKTRFDSIVSRDPAYRDLQEKIFSFYDEAQQAMGKDKVDTILRNYGFEGDDKLRGQYANRIFNNTLSDTDREKLTQNIGAAAMKAIDNVDALKVKNGPYVPLMRRGDYVTLGRYKIKETPGGRAIDEDTREFKSRDQAHKFAVENGLHYEPKVVYYDTATGERVATKADAISTAGEPEQRYQVRLQRDHVSFHETAAEAKAAAKELVDTGTLEKATVQERKNLTSQKSEFTGRGVETLLASLAKSERYNDLTDAQRDTLKKTIRDTGLQSMADNRIQARRLPRRYVQGASEDAIRAMIDYNHAQANYRANMKFREPVNDLLKNMWDAVKRGQYDTNDLERSKLANEIEKRAQAPDPNQNSGAWSSWTRRVMAWSYIDRMLRASHLVLHQTHLPMITAPYMAGRHGVGAFGETMRAWKQLSRFYNAGAHDAFVSLTGSPLQEFSDYAKVGKRAMAEQADAARLDKLYDSLAEDGTIHPSMGQEVDKYTPSREATGLVGGIDRGLNKLDTIFRQLTNATEAINRMAGATAAYRLEFSRLTREGKSEAAAHDSAVEYARRTIADTQGRFSATNAAPLFKNPVLKPFLQFKQFPQMMYHLLGKLAVQSLKGENTQVKVQAMASLASILGMHMMMAGVLQGLPLEPFKLLGMISKGIGLTSGDWSDVEAAVTRSLNANFGTDIGHLLTRGLGAELGVDVHHRLGLNSFATYGMPEQIDEKSTSDFLMNAVGGAPYGMVKDVMQGITKMLNGDVEGGALQAVPLQALRDVHNAVNPSPNKYGYQPTAADRVKSVLGFTPEAKAAAAAQKEAVYNAIQDYDQKRNGFIKAWTGAPAGDRAEVWNKISAWNTSLPASSRLSKGDLYKALSRQTSTAATGRSVDFMKVNRSNAAVAKAAFDTYQ